jgi:hypothetical protein
VSVRFVVADVLEWTPPRRTALILCDPPYGTGRLFRSPIGLPALDDRDADLPRRILDRLLGFGVPLAFFAEPEFLVRECGLPTPDRLLFWKTSWISGLKSRACFPRQVDVIACWHLRTKRVVRLRGRTLGNLIADDRLVSPVHKSFVRRKGGLPVEKPWQLGALLARAFSDPGDLVIDACCGTGALAYGAHVAGRRAIGFDIVPEYVERARSLWSDRQWTAGRRLR